MAELTEAQRERVIDRLIGRWAETMDISDLINYFRDKTEEWLKQEDDEALIELARTNGASDIIEEERR